VTWFKVDDKFHSHRKTLQLMAEPEGMAAIGLWVIAGSWCADQLTDGFVPRYVLKHLATDSGHELAKLLVKVGFWEEAQVNGQDGYLFHQWGEHQPSREAVIQKRSRNARRQALVRDPALRDSVRRRDADMCRYCAVKVKWNDRRSGIGGTYDHLDPDGPNSIDNLVVCCRACNARKQNRPLQTCGMQLLEPPPASQKPVSRYAPKTNLDSARPPTRPFLKEEGEGGPSSEPDPATDPEGWMNWQRAMIRNQQKL
jgi:5-methylcytosine-specific restriction endonuclease McrA